MSEGDVSQQYVREPAKGQGANIEPQSQQGAREPAMSQGASHRASSGPGNQE